MLHNSVSTQTAAQMEQQMVAPWQLTSSEYEIVTRNNAVLILNLVHAKANDLLHELWTHL